jgi:ATP synthase protein I
MDPENPYRTIGLIGTLGIEITAFIIGGVYLGKFLDHVFHTSPVWLVIGIFGGLILGILSALFTLRAFIKD